MRRLPLALTVAVFVLQAARCQVLASGAQTPSPSLYSQSAAQALSQAFATCAAGTRDADPLCSERENISYLLLDSHGVVLASDWANSDTPVPLGSLVKPFAALAYGEKHQFKYPVYLCRGTASGCWLPRGHGRIGLESAIANSCNSYFRMLTRDLTVADVQPIASMFALQQPDAGAAGSNFAGLGGHWLISPLAMARAYVELSQRSDQPGVRAILAGMAQSGKSGTGAEVGRALRRANALVKTGTAPCTHARRAPGDGFVIAMLPVDHPQILLMVRIHGMPGARAARIAGELLQRMEP